MTLVRSIYIHNLSCYLLVWREREREREREYCYLFRNKVIYKDVLYIVVVIFNSLYIVVCCVVITFSLEFC